MERLTWTEIEQRYNHEHIQLVDFDWPEDEINPRSGIVHAHAKSLRELAVLNNQSPAHDAALLYVGEIKSPPGTMLSCNLVRIAPR